MKLFDCQACGQTLYFENTKCESCGHRLGYAAEDQDLHAIQRTGGDDDLAWEVVGTPSQSYRLCQNAQYDVCNWLIPAEQQNQFCLACRHNHLVPDLARPGNQDLWRLMETAKHRLFYTLLQLKLPLIARTEDPREGLMFDFLEDPPNGQKVMTGHDLGKITISIAEADDAERERRRKSMHEPYRTMLGHFRHEIAHYYWDRLVRDTPALDPFRSIFGDERDDYAGALQRHYTDGAPLNWRERFVSAYATSHPWEDFAETFAHYLHIVDTLETAEAFGIRVRPRRIAHAAELSTHVDFHPDQEAAFAPLVKAWFPLTFALNSLNRSMGLSDLYPFVLTPPIIAKLSFVHDLVHGTLGTQDPAASRDDSLAPVSTHARLPSGPTGSVIEDTTR